MNSIKYKWLAPLSLIRRQKKISETALAHLAQISRATLRHIEAHRTNIRYDNIAALAHALKLNLQLITYPESCNPELSTLGVSYEVLKDGLPSWKIHFMNLIDEFRHTLDPRLLLMPPAHAFPPKLKALLASITLSLCHEACMDAPSWAKKKYFLSTPWFVSESNALKASALLESPLFFRRNNIFVLNNFMERA